MISIVPPALSSPIFTGLGCQFVKRHTYCLRSGRRQIKRWPRELDPITHHDGSQAHNRPNALGVPVVTRAEENMRVLEGGEGMALH
jgi:hypothetical protein